MFQNSRHIATIFISRAIFIFQTVPDSISTPFFFSQNFLQFSTTAHLTSTTSFKALHTSTLHPTTPTRSARCFHPVAVQYGSLLTTSRFVSDVQYKFIYSGSIIVSHNLTPFHTITILINLPGIIRQTEAKIDSRWSGDLAQFFAKASSSFLLHSNAKYSFVLRNCAVIFLSTHLLFRSAIVIHSVF